MVIRMYLEVLVISCCYLQASSSSIVEFAVTDVLCTSNTWMAHSSSASDLIRVNQTETALINAKLHRNKQQEGYYNSKIQLNPNQVVALSCS